MTFLSAWSLLGLIAVAAVAAWALFRPARQLAVVGSLSLWQQALDSLSAPQRRRSRRISAAWVCLLLGAAAAVLAAARPASVESAPARRVAVVVWPSAQAAGAMPDLKAKTKALLSRLGANDRVQLVLPQLLGGGKWLSPGDAAAAIDKLQALPVPSDKLEFPPPDTAAQHVYHVFPAGAAAPRGPDISHLPVKVLPPPITLEAIGAVNVSEAKGQLFLALRNHTDERLHVSFTVAGTGETLNIAPRSRQDVVRDFVPADSVKVRTEVPLGGPTYAETAWLVRHSGRAVKVAIIGPDEPLLRRFVAADSSLELVPGPQQADVVIANATGAPDGKPALVIDPPAPPAGWMAGPEAGNVPLSSAVVKSDHAVMKSVDLSGVAVRRLAAWAPGDGASQTPLVSFGGGAIILLDAPEAAEKRPSRVYVSFDLSAENTNFATSPSLVIFLSNAMRFLAGGVQTQTTYDWQAPLDAGPISQGWTVQGAAKDASNGPLPPPGMYKDSSGAYHAVNLVGVEYPTSDAPAAAVESLPLPPPQPTQSPREYWPALVIAAMAMWLTGWLLRIYT